MVMLNKEEIEANEYKAIECYQGSARKVGKIQEWLVKSAKDNNLNADRDHEDKIKDPEEEFQETSQWNKEVKEQPGGELADIPNVGGCYWDGIGVNKAYEWCFEDTEDDNLASKFDTDEFWWRKLQLRKIKEETLEENNNNSDEGKGNKAKKYLKKEALSLACKRWNGRYQTSDKESYNLPISGQEVIQNTEYAGSSECVIFEVGYINECVDIAEVLNNKIINQLFDPGGSTFLKVKETAWRLKSTHI
ncbi:hypothetical protein F8M41_025589 [Gigaspora margarita]|uniref:Uncharacterized protein n=1 Tax=Gigaspora margarita TaxID=4874 RepID=A0A8H4AA25_GIGMA|nr:hypothetical protein F8M41_025589 [Gigaspora margarita]